MGVGRMHMTVVTGLGERMQARKGRDKDQNMISPSDTGGR